jgi:hypothetical protein
MRLFATTLATGAALLAATPTSASAQQASLVYRLGKDTVAIEQYTRSATGMTGEMVQRSGAAVARYQYTITLAKNGRPTTASIKRLNADGSLPPNTPSDTRFTVTADSIVRETVFADSTPRRAFAAKQAMINFPTFIYGPTELLAALAKTKAPVDSLPALGLTGNLGVTGITAAGGDSVRLRGGAYAMILRFDANQRLQSVDGAFTTNKSVGTRGGERASATPRVTCAQRRVCAVVCVHAHLATPSPRRRWRCAATAGTRSAQCRRRLTAAAGARGRRP